MAMSWATTLMSGDAEERAIVTASMNTIGQAISAWSQLLEYPAVDAPNFHKGFITTSCIAVLQLVNMGVIWFLARREVGQKRKIIGKESDSNEVRV
jgi:ACS family pantothenate transporter-like MFS transporter